MKKHILGTELCEHKDWMELSNCPSLHKEDFCLLCGYFMEGDRLYLEIHGSNGALNRVKDIDSSQPYVCMECAVQFRMISWDRAGRINRKRLTNFIREKK